MIVVIERRIPPPPMAKPGLGRKLDRDGDGWLASSLCVRLTEGGQADCWPA